MEMTELEDLECAYAELHKDVYGVKARWYKAPSIEQARVDLACLEHQAKRVWAQEKQDQIDAAVRFEARIDNTIKSGAKTRETALRWIHQAEGTDGDAEFLCHACGLKYGYFKTTHAHLM